MNFRKDCLTFAIGVVILIGSTILATSQGEAPTVKAIPPELMKVLNDADSQVASSLNAVLKTAEGQAWRASENYREARVLYVMSELGLKPSEGWRFERDDNGKPKNFSKKEKPAKQP